MLRCMENVLSIFDHDRIKYLPHVGENDFIFICFEKKCHVLKAMLMLMCFIKYSNHDILWTCSSHKKMTVNHLNQDIALSYRWLKETCLQQIQVSFLEII